MPAVLIAAEAVVATVGSEGISDHSSGAGRLSEALLGIAFLTAAVALVLFLPRGVPARVTSLPGIAATALTGVAMLSVTVTGEEWPEPIVTALVLVNLVGLIAQGVIAWRTRVWPWWVGLLVSLFLPARSDQHHGIGRAVDGFRHGLARRSVRMVPLVVVRIDRLRHPSATGVARPPSWRLPPLST
jgi:hypothetical protein